MAETGAVNWMFNKTGVVRATGTTTEDELLEKLLDYNVHDISCEDNFCTINCNPKSLDQIKKAVTDAGLRVESAETEWVATNPMQLTEAEQEQAIAFLDALEDHDDVQNVYTNLA